MYTSFYGTNNSLTRSKQGKHQISTAPPSKDELQAEMQSKTGLQLGQHILDGKAVVKAILSESAFILYHEDFRQEFMARKIPDDEIIDKWIDLQTHSNIVTAFDSFVEENSGVHYAMCELTNGGNMYQHILSQRLDLAIDVPRSYLELIYDVAIQLATGLDFAHSAGLVHGQFDLSKIVIDKDKKNLVFKIQDFAPGSSMKIPVSTEANYWPFSRQKKTISDREKLEVLMLKDIYSLGICILEMMIGRTSKQNFSISLSSLPLTWAEFPESTALIQVLVECIQIDSITQRKGKLQHIRKLLIREFKKYFQKTFYKMENPFVGKKADVLNKKGIVAFFNREQEQAVECWEQARMISDRHFDSQCNYSMYRWSTGQIADAQMMAELGDFVFTTPGKGECLEAYLKIAMGEREEGIQILRSFLEREKENMKGQRLKNLKMSDQVKSAQQVFESIQLDKTIFFQNTSLNHGHKQNLRRIKFSENNRFMTTISQDACKLWRVGTNLIGDVIMIPFEEFDDEEQYLDHEFHCCVDNSGKYLIAMHGSFKLDVYIVEDEGEKFEKRDTINLTREILANGNPGFSFSRTLDSVTELKFDGDQCEVVRVSVLKNNGDFLFIDVTLSDNVAKLTKAERCSDKGIFKIDSKGDFKMIELQQIMREEVEENFRKKNQIAFPMDNRDIIAVLNREDRSNKYFQIYDLRRQCYIRRISKRLMEEEAFAVDMTAKILTYGESDQLVVKSIRLPNSETLIDQLRPRFAVAKMKLNPAVASENKQQFKDKLYRELHAYHYFKADPDRAERQMGLNEEQNIHLMVMKYEESTSNPFKMKANRELMMLQKVLLRDSAKTAAMKDLQAKCPLINCEGLKRVEIYDDELTFASRSQQIDLVRMSSEPHRNFFLLAMDGVVYKYDLVTKELLFQFKTPCNKAIILYEADDKLVAASQREIRLWDFHDHKEEAPTLLTAMETSFNVQHVFTNDTNVPEQANYVLITSGSSFQLFTKRLELRFQDTLDDEEDNVIMSAEFDNNLSTLLIGTKQSKLYFYDLSLGKQGQDPFRVGGESQGITSIKALRSLTDQQKCYIVTVAEKELFLYDQLQRETKQIDLGDKGEQYGNERICNVVPSFNSKFFAIGIPSKRAFGVFKVDRTNLRITPPTTWITKYPFDNFYADAHLSSVMFIDKDKKQLDYHFLLWKFDTSRLDIKSLTKLDAGSQFQAPDEEEVEFDSDGNEIEPKEQVERSNASACCTIF